ncbi:uncharacterized protein LOC107785682 [Nicotiana tabacum]|uniref:Uncharacterized protein isoform X1 n=2 Tax=Nicotiana tabacum TaxID=4097 RepID=A0A1S3ZDN0_TOBAC|nr:PREDICTED: uncharacterized protein LOC107785682 isoform X1 [Nicotiana tabacum]XP_016462529.1 PREDICTED: uncharacterized protein LOC107785682 isoform X2 [Nicotiana tabacum]
MAFHVACPITCRRICYCPLGFPKGKNEFLEDVVRVEEFLKDPWLLKAKEGATIQVKVPKIVVAPQPPQQVAVGDGGGGGDGEEAAAIASAQTKRAALQKKAAAASMVAEDFARRFESGDLEGSVKDVGGEEQGLSNVKVMCRLCFCGENEGSEKARKMMSCKSCGKKYHRGCLKAWGQHRDLFHWSSWTCPSCRLCEACRRTGDPNKFMFCKRCDGAYHCYCMQPPHKNVSSGPYLCPKHTKCHSCGSNVPGNGLSVRWFLGYTCCDACGRLFVKGNYCPVCLKVYRDSEATPMVCCDICQRWVHCQCDGISDEKYMQFQVDGNLQYACPTCRGNSYQVRNLEDAVQELWRRRDEADKDLIASLRAGAGLPVDDEIFSISPFSDDEDSGPVVKNEHSRSLKFSLKGLVDKSPKKSKDYGKKSSYKKSGKKKGQQLSLTGQNETHPDGAGYVKNEELQAYGELDSFSSPVGSLTEGICSINQAGVIKHKFIDEVTGNKGKRTVQIKGSKPQRLDGDDIGIQTSMPKTSKGPKLVIHLGSRNKNVAGSPKSDASSCQKDQDLTTSNGSEDLGQLRENENSERNDTAAKFGGGKGHKVDHMDQIKGQNPRGKESHLIKIKKVSSEATHLPAKVGGKFADVSGPIPPVKTFGILGKRSNDGNVIARAGAEVPATRGNKLASSKYAEAGPASCDDLNDEKVSTPSVSNSTRKDPKPLLKLKFKNPYHESQNAWASPGEEEKSMVKGQRSKRKRPPAFGEKASTKADDNSSQWYEDSTMDEFMDANWILQKLGKDAKGKRVEVHHPSDNTWHRGTVIEVFEGSSIVSVALDDGKKKNLELGKQGIRFVCQKQKR